ncbi:MAG: hypothetical protein A3G87_05360 [Omnitrophica bacterium RIFCSPLOWO2_12_FULL_50_11]|nr:MAG: hypothetical protein A3G87_05360 [Omnitrophica bacterium RIFCSPLOWO2_12_FULL_50_11]
MLSLRRHKKFVWRYALAGVLNGIVGFSAIFILMELGASPFISNLSGYALGLAIGFATSKLFVFRSKNQMASEAWRYITAFGVSYLANLIVLAVTLSWLVFPPILAQTAAVSTYVLVMYMLAHFFVYSKATGTQSIKD